MIDIKPTWTDVDDERLRFLDSQNETLEDIAMMMGRTDEDIEARADRHKLTTAFDKVCREQDALSELLADDAADQCEKHAAADALCIAVDSLRADRTFVAAPILRSKLQSFVDTWAKQIENDDPIAGSEAIDFICSFWKSCMTLLDRINDSIL